MNNNRLTIIGRVSLLCLIAGSFSGKTNPALADIPNTLDKNQPEPLAKIEASTTEGAIANSNIYSATDTESISSTIVKLDQTDTNKYDTPVLPQTQQLDLETSKVKIEPDEQRNSNNSSLPSESNTLAQLIESNNLDSSGLEQVTSVSQLSDVRPSDWAYEALRNLVERYGCIAGYPDGTFRGNRAMTRYEFAAGLNACLQQIERLIGNNSPNTNPQDLTTLRRLVDEFQVELSTLGARVDKIEGRVSYLEEHQFSTTTKLEGEAIFSLVGATGGDPDTGDNANLILVDRVRLNLKTSFTGKDLLITGLQANNFGGDAFGAGSVQGTLFPGRDAFLSEGSTKLSFEPQFPRFTPQDLSTTNGSNNVQLYKLLYIFPSGIKNLTLFGGTSAEVSDAFPTIIPFASEGQGAISRFATLNPVLRVSGGTSQTGLASAAGFIWGISDKLDFRALYGSVNAAIPNQGANNVLGAGFFSGSSVAAAQLTIKPSKSFDIGLNYAHSYHDLNILGIGNSRYSSSPLFIPGQTQDLTGNLNLAGTLNTPIHVNSIGATLTWRVAPKIAFTGYGSYFFVDSAAGADASSNFSSWMVGLHFQDLLKEGNSAGLIFGQPLYRVSADGAAKLAEPDIDRATPYHLEAFYNFRVNDNISITPAAFVLFNPEGDANNDTTLVGAIRTTFTF
ncbi:iron uptake porin [Limnofasciculus baicalensis]|uniref:Iron uptake porin n=1 Tax=Limnofasciculus baicalensis BBK-W-15 TaxID=2699891 RepID=A0AAE3GUN3_9CYAN|nr:iron uptake porin [Limnofasciculus baicalensis]MCP2730296.1 iron uptake porin [Limnofasciculus baicalensis BBK-W-15]